MTDPTPSETEVLKGAYTAFNARDIDAALALMSAGVGWPRAFKGGFVQGHAAVRAYWTEQWREIDPRVEPLSFHRENAESMIVEVRQVVRDLGGALIAEDRVGHRFAFANRLIDRMEVVELPRAGIGV